MTRLLSAGLIVLGVPALARAGGVAAPEIDLSAAPAGLIFLGAALTILRGRRKKQ